MKILIDRKWKKPTYTIGIAYIDGVRFSETMEDPDRGLSDKMTEEEVKTRKVYGQTAIPTGTYEVKLTYSPKFANRTWGKKYKGLVPSVEKVKGFSGVRLHPLNTAADSLGCLGFGRNTKVGMITDATKYYYKLMDNHILPAIRRGEKIELTIR
jgi:hypothetical protein